MTLDRLSPLERAAFLRHDVFDFSCSEVATALERSEAACGSLPPGVGWFELQRRSSKIRRDHDGE